MSEDQTKMPMPTTDLDLQAQTLEPFISGDYVSREFKNKFIVETPSYKRLINSKGEFLKDEFGNVRLEVLLDEKGNPLMSTNKDIWSVLQIFNRDWRLGNIDTTREAIYIRHYIDLTSDILITLGDKFREPALICLERALVVNETSQSKGGFLRKLLNTFIHKTTRPDEEAGKKRNLFGLGKKKNNSGGGYT